MGSRTQAATFGPDNELNAIIKSLRLNFPSSIKSPLRQTMAVAPTITSGATTSMVANSRSFPLGYSNPLSAVSITGFSPVVAISNSQLLGDNITTNFALDAFSQSTRRISFIHTGQYFELRFIASANNIFYVKVDGEYESVTPITETLAYRKYDLGSSATRKIEIIAGGATTSHVIRNIIIGPTDTITKVSPDAIHCIAVGDSFCANASSFPNSFATALGWSNVWGSGVSGSGYVHTAGDTLPTYGMRLQHDVIDYEPQVVIFCGSVNDDAYTYAQIYAAALDVYTRTKSSLPNALIVAFHTARGGADTETSASIANRAAKKAAAAAAGIMWVDPTEQENELPYKTGTVVTTAAAGASLFIIDIPFINEGYGLINQTISLGDDAGGTGERYLVIDVTASGLNTLVTIAGTLATEATATDPITMIGNSYLSGIGRVGATTGIGNSDTLVSSDGTHPTDPAGYDALGVAVASALINKIGST